MKKSAGFVIGLAFAAMFATHVWADGVSIDVKDDSGVEMTGDPDHGKALFGQCMVCHSIKEGENKIGPSLHGIIGRPAGSIANYAYSAANKKSGITWTPQEIFVYLKNPQAKVPGTKMTFPGFPKPQDRADVIAYLEQNAK
jgi:cytochrome c